MKNRSLIIVIGLLFITNCIQAQNRNIYIWDVTGSMWGKGWVTNPDTNQNVRTPNIYNNVVEYIVNDIENIKSTNTEIVVVPFQERVIEQHIFTVPNATKENKLAIIEKIKNSAHIWESIDHSWTNISQPIEYVQRCFQKNDRANKLILLTDGHQNTNGGMEALTQAINKWCNEAGTYDFCIYVLTTENAIQPTAEKPNVMYVKPDDFVSEIEQLVLSPQEVVKYNIKDDKTLRLTFTDNADIAIPNGIKIRVQSKPGAPVTIDEVVDMKDAELQITPQYTYEELKRQIPEELSLPLNLSVINNDELREKERKVIILNPQQTTLKLINKKERVLTINIVKE